MITLCWAAKGGSGTTVVAASLAIAASQPALLVDLVGDLPAALGAGEPSGPGIFDWLKSGAPPDRLANLEFEINQRISLLPSGCDDSPIPSDVFGQRWSELIEHLRHDDRRIIIDAGTGSPPANLLAGADNRWLVTRACYLSLRSAVRQQCQPTGVILIDEPGRALRAADIESALGAPIVATLLIDPAVARAVDAGLLMTRLPVAFQRRLRGAA